MKVTKIICSFFLCMCTYMVSAQGFIVYGGMNISNVDFNYKNNSESKIDAIYGFRFGLSRVIEVSENLNIQPGIGYAQKGYNFNIADKWGQSSSGEDAVRLNYLEVPIDLVYKVGSFRVSAGPYFSIMLNGSREWDVTTTSFEESDKIRYRPFRGKVTRGDVINLDDDQEPIHGLDLGLNFGIGFELGSFIVTGSYGLGLSNLRPQIETFNNRDEFKEANRTLSLSVGFRLSQ